MMAVTLSGRGRVSVGARDAGRRIEVVTGVGLFCPVMPDTMGIKVPPVTRACLSKLVDCVVSCSCPDRS